MNKIREFLIRTLAQKDTVILNVNITYEECVILTGTCLVENLNVQGLRTGITVKQKI